MVKIAIHGAAGRMGRRIADLAIANENLELAAAVDNEGHPDLGKDIGELAGAGAIGVEVKPALDVDVDVVIDFSLPDGTMKIIDTCVEKGIAIVIGTTGLDESQSAKFKEASSKIPVFHTANMSVGVNVLLKAVAQVAGTLGEDYDIEVSEIHHRFKKDAPSGTAIALAKSICDATGKDYNTTAVHGRQGDCPRNKGEIGMHAIRVGDTVGEHSVFFGNLGETITISHSAHSRDIFANGSLRAAAWLAGKPAGLYDMKEVLGLN